MDSIIKVRVPAVDIEIAEAHQFVEINKLYDQIGFVHSTPEKDTVILAKSDDKIVGLGRLVEINLNTAELGGMYVLEGYRGQGIADKIISKLLSIPKANSYERIFCLPFEKLKGFYGRYGFVESTESNAPDMILQKHQWCHTQYLETVLLLVKMVGRQMC